MKSVHGFTKIFGVALLALAASLSASPARAGGDTLSSKLTLPVETRFGSAILPAGDYTLVVETLGGQKVLSLRGNGKTAISLAIDAEASPVSDHDQLTLVQDGDGYVVSAVSVGSLGLTFHYAASHSGASMSARARKSSMHGSGSNAK